MARTPDKPHAMPLARNRTGRVVILTSLSLLALGVVMVHSATSSVVEPGAWYARSTIRHMIFAAAAAMVLLVAWRIDYRRLIGGERNRPVVAGCLLALALICAVLVFIPGIGRSVGSDFRWIRIGPFRYKIGLQPSELIKIALPVFLAAWLARAGADVRSFRKVFIPAMLLIAVCVGLVVTQDFGTAAIIGVSAVATLALAGAPWHYLMALAAPAAGAFYALVMRSPARWARITAMMDVWSTSNPSAHQPRQSLLAILTGGWLGKGPGAGTLKLGYLPEDSTDFIFSALCEEWGFVGGAVLMGLWVVWICSAWQSALESRDRFGRLLAGSLGFMIVLQAILHVAVDTVALPPTGMSMPFVSAGGTSLLLTAAGAALIVSVSSRRNSPDLVEKI